MKTLYAIEQDGAKLAMLLEASDGELTPEIGEIMEVFDADIHAKAEIYCKIIASFEGRQVMRETEAKRLKALADTDARAADRLRERLHSAILFLNIPKIETDLFRISVVNNPPSVKVEDAETLPNKYKRLKIEADKSALMADFKAGLPLPEGVMIERTTRLKIA